MNRVQLWSSEYFRPFRKIRISSLQHFNWGIITQNSDLNWNLPSLRFSFTRYKLPHVSIVFVLWLKVSSTVKHHPCLRQKQNITDASNVSTRDALESIFLRAPWETYVECTCCVCTYVTRGREYISLRVSTYVTKDRLKCPDWQSPTFERQSYLHDCESC